MTADNLKEKNLTENSTGTDSMDLQARQIAGLLNTHANELSMRTLKQLENGREIAVKAHQQKISGVSINQDGTINHLFSWAEHHRIASAGLLLGAIVAGFVIMQSLQPQTERGDAFLLSAELPPEAFVDTGFAPLLNTTQAKL